MKSSHNKGHFEYCWTPIWMQDDEVMNEPEETDIAPSAMSIATEAEAIVEERGRHYGPPSRNHSCTADFFRGYLNRRYGVDVPLDAEDVCWLNVLQKISRQAHVRKRDNKVDVIGFVINADMLD